jgi:hypothetical protein
MAGCFFCTASCVLSLGDESVFADGAQVHACFHEVVMSPRLETSSHAKPVPPRNHARIKISSWKATIRELGLTAWSVSSFVVHFIRPPESSRPLLQFCLRQNPRFVDLFEGCIGLRNEIPSPVRYSAAGSSSPVQTSISQHVAQQCTASDRGPV